MADLPIAQLASEFPPLLWCMLAWLFAVGGCIGSFMNVVIYRLPAGLSLLHPPSRCPACETPIRATDNVPMLGWLWLRGRCRSCRAAISARYPAVELLVALVFVGLACAEPLNAGRNLPAAAQGMTQYELWGIYAYHLFLLCSLICAAFTEFDGQRLTPRLTVPALLIGVAAPEVWPHLRPASILVAGPPWWANLVEGSLGAIGGAAIGYLIGFAARVRRQAFDPIRSAHAGSIAFAWTGAFLGLEAVLALAVAAGATFLLAIALQAPPGDRRRLPVGRRIGLVGYLTPWTGVWILAWRTIAEALDRL
ncbi:MAG TPA: prepilin peptidase [Pirellulales bacterium]|nr:prepilin peptidase [Pirellulales bacterium]